MIRGKYIKAGGGGVCPTYTLIPDRPPLTQPASGNIHDEYWHKINGTYDIVVPPNPITQAIDPLDVTKILHDDSAVTGLTQHKFRYVGYKGGYYDESDSTYRTIDGVLSTYIDEFYTVDNYYVIDRLSWLGRLGVRVGINRLDDSMTIAPYSYCGFSDLYITTLGQMMQLLNRPDIQFPTQNPPLNISQQFGTCTFNNNGAYSHVFTNQNTARLVESTNITTTTFGRLMIRVHNWGVDDSI